MIIVTASDSHTLNKTKSNIIILITQFFFTLINLKNNETSVFGIIPSSSIVSDQSTSLKSDNQTSISSPRDSDQVSDNNRPIFIRNIKHALAVKDRKFFLSKYVVFVIL